MSVEGRGLTSRKVPKGAKARRMTMSLTPPKTVGKLQTVLHEKAKASPGYRYYALYDKRYRKDVLAYGRPDVRRY